MALYEGKVCNSHRYFSLCLARSISNFISMLCDRDVQAATSPVLLAPLNESVSSVLKYQYSSSTPSSLTFRS